MSDNTECLVKECRISGTTVLFSSGNRRSVICEGNCKLLQLNHSIETNESIVSVDYDFLKLFTEFKC
jgi:hypothetical protein